MTHILDWAPTHTSLVSAIATTSGALAANGQAIADKLAADGAVYDTAYAGAGVDAAKGAWLTAAGAAWSSADLIFRYVGKQNTGSDPGALTFDSTYLGVFNKRAATKLSTDDPILSAVVASEIAAAVAALMSIWDPNDDEANAFLGAPYRDDATLTVNGVTTPLHRIRMGDSVRHLELATVDQMHNAIAWIAAAAGP